MGVTACEVEGARIAGCRVVESILCHHRHVEGVTGNDAGRSAHTEGGGARWINRDRIARSWIAGFAVSLTLRVWLPGTLRVTALVKPWLPLSPKTKM